MPKKITEEEKEKVCQQYNEGVTLRGIASSINISQNTVMNILKERGIKRRKGRSITDEQKEKVEELYVKGISIREIMLSSSVKSEQTIYRIIDERNLKRRRI